MTKCFLQCLQTKKTKKCRKKKRIEEKNRENRENNMRIDCLIETYVIKIVSNLIVLKTNEIVA